MRIEKQYLEPGRMRRHSKADEKKLRMKQVTEI